MSLIISSSWPKQYRLRKKVTLFISLSKILDHAIAVMTKNMH